MKDENNKDYQFVAITTFGDPVSHEQLSAAWGLFDSRQDAEDWANDKYSGKNHIIDILPLNKLEKMRNPSYDDVEADGYRNPVLPFKKP